MPLVFEEVHASPDKKHVNQEWFILANMGASPVSTAGLQVIVGLPGKRGSVRVRSTRASSAARRANTYRERRSWKVSQGDPPVREGMRTYHLFQREGLLHGSGTILRFAMNQVDIAPRRV